MTFTTVTVISTNPRELIVINVRKCLSTFESFQCPSRSKPHSSSPLLDARPRIIQPDPTCTARRHRHSISGQMSYFKLLGYNVSKKLTGSANSLFSTAVISGSSSAPNLKDMVPSHASCAVAGDYFSTSVFKTNI